MREVRVYGRMGDRLTNVNFRLNRILALLATVGMALGKRDVRSLRSC